MISEERVRLRPIEREDLPRFVRWFADPEVRAGLRMHLGMSLAMEERWFEGILQRPADEQPQAIEVRTGRDQWEHIGSAGFHGIDWRNRSAEVGIVIGEKRYWNQGLGTEVMRLLLEHAFDTLNLRRVYLRVFEDNPRAQRTYEKVGFVLEGRLRQAEFRRGTYRDVRLYSLLQEEWAKRGANPDREPR
ncbi:MAG: GNAT family protein [Anaerolineales bacterium]|jgi:RimJ/RimL family protein N-acetyltransferase